MAGLCFCMLAFVCCVESKPVPEVAAPEPEALTARLVFVGDVMSHSPQVSAARREWLLKNGEAAESEGHDYTGVFKEFRPIFAGADVVVANLETTLRTRPPYTGYPSFAAPAELASAMHEAGIDIVTTANNHICDKGAAGIRSTLAILDSVGVEHTGAFPDSLRRPLLFSAGGIDFALLTYTYGTNGMPVPKGFSVNLIDTTVIARDLAAIKKLSPDCIIVSYHWGEEYRRHPTREQRRLAGWTRARGADIIIGGHPHVVEPFEAHYNADSTLVTGATYYSLGNFVSNQRRRYTDGGMAAEITVTKTDSATLVYEPAYRLLWVHTPAGGSGRSYRMLPASTIDSLSSGDTPHALHGSEYAAARLFLDDTRELLSAADTIFVEK